MKKTKFVAIVLVIAVVLMGAGYAYWTDSVQINNNVTTGNFDMIFNYPIPGVDSAHNYDNISWADYVNNGQAGESGISITNNDKKLNFVFTNYYPGAGATMKFNIVNNGTVPAKLENLEFKNKVDNDSIGGKLEYTISKMQLKGPNGTTDIPNTPVTYTTLAAFEAGLEDLLDDVTIGVGEYIQINGGNNSPNSPNGYDITLPLGTTVDHSTENATISFDIEMTWKQWNQ